MKCGQQPGLDLLGAFVDVALQIRDGVQQVLLRYRFVSHKPSLHPLNPNRLPHLAGLGRRQPAGQDSLKDTFATAALAKPVVADLLRQLETQAALVSRVISKLDDPSQGRKHLLTLVAALCAILAEMARVCIEHLPHPLQSQSLPLELAAKKQGFELCDLWVISNTFLQEVIGKAFEPAVSHLNFERPGRS